MIGQTSNALLDRNNMDGHIICPSILNRNSDRRIVNHGDLTKAKPLIRFLFDLHWRKGLLPQRSFESYYGEARKFIRIVDPSKVEDLMLKAADVAKHSWGFGFVRKMEEDRIEKNVEFADS